MKLDQNIANLIYELEYLIGDQCHIKTYKNYYTGEIGKEFRYPVSYLPYPGADTTKKTREYVQSYVGYEQVRTLHYQFGSNLLYIGTGLTEILEFLEKRYNINFNELENEYLKTRKP